MALCTGHADVRTGQGKRRVVVIEGRLGPGRGVMAGGTSGGEAGCDVVRVSGSGVIGFVARVAICGHRRVVAVGMALRAWNGGVRTCQREGPSRMVESGRAPAGGGVA